MQLISIPKIVFALLIGLNVGSCKKRGNQQEDSSGEIKTIQGLLKKQCSTSNIEATPLFVKYEKCVDFSQRMAVEEIGGTMSFIFGEMSLVVSPEKQVVRDYTMLSFSFWKDALMQRLLSTQELLSMNSGQINTYAQQMGLKSRLMLGRKESLICEGDVNNLTCVINADGELEGRIWSNDQNFTKVFHGKILMNDPNRYCFIAQLSRAELFE